MSFFKLNPEVQNLIYATVQADKSLTNRTVTLEIVKKAIEKAKLDKDLPKDAQARVNFYDAVAKVFTKAEGIHIAYLQKGKEIEARNQQRAEAKAQMNARQTRMGFLPPKKG